MSTVGDCDLPGRLSSLGAEALDLLDDLHPLHHLAEHHVLPVQPGSLGSADEELRVVGVRAGVGHGEDPGACVLQTEVLVSKLLAVDGAATSSVVVGEVAGLTHEVGDHSVKGGALVTEPLLPGAQSPEVLAGLGGHVGPELHQDSPHRGRVCRHLEIYPGSHCPLSGVQWIGDATGVLLTEFV